MHITRAPQPSLHPWVKTLWATVPERAEPPLPCRREHVLPTGYMHLVLRLDGPALRVFCGPDDVRGHTVGHAVVGGARSSYYIRETGVPSQSVGALLLPGAARLLFGAPASELAERHTPLDLLWREAAYRLHEQLLQTGDAARRLDLLEAAIGAKVRSAAPHPAIAHALKAFAAGARVHEAVQAIGYSHRHFASLFYQATGLTPKLYCRVRRFQAALHYAGALGGAAASWASVAQAAGYSDQAHFNREFVRFTGVTPSTYKALAPANANHLILPPRRER